MKKDIKFILNQMLGYLPNATPYDTVSDKVERQARQQLLEEFRAMREEPTEKQIKEISQWRLAEIRREIRQEIK